MDNIKEAFKCVGDDIDFLNQDIFFLNSEITEIKNQLRDICDILEKLSKNNTSLPKESSIDISTDRHINPTFSTHSSTDRHLLEPLNDQNMPISIGNRGVSTDRQTDRQTNQQTQNSIENAAEILDSLDSLKKEIRIKFKRLTEQEILVFSALYQLDELNGSTDYKSLAIKLSLTESSIRDYIRRLINKGIPIEKKKINNKSIQLSISNNLKKIATLSTILQLREI